MKRTALRACAGALFAASSRLCECTIMIGHMFTVRVVIRADYIRLRTVRALNKRDAMDDTLDLYSLTLADIVSISAHKV